MVVTVVFVHNIYLLNEILKARAEGRPSSSDVSCLSGISGLSVDSMFLSALSLFCLVLLLILSSPFFCFWPCSLLQLPMPSTEISLNLFSPEIGFLVLPLFLVCLVFISWSVIGVAYYLIALVLLLAI